MNRKLGKKSIFVLIFLIFITLFVGSVWTPFSDPNSTWFEYLEKPVFNPPSWMFGPVWTILYILMGVSIFKIYNSTLKDSIKYKIYVLYTLQLLLNSLWTPTFFLFQQIGLALVVISLLWIILIIILFLYYQHNKVSFYLWIPNVLWVSFAAILNLGFFILN